MKGIALCADCAYYDLKKHKCNRGATVDPDISKGHDVRFYVDCPLDDVEPVRHGRWIFGRVYGTYHCSECDKVETERSEYCRKCGAKMDGGAEKCN